MLKYEKRICGIYKITNNISGRCYVGKSECNVFKRLEEHKKDTHNSGLKEDFKLYDINDFSFEVLLICDRDDVGFFEKFFIKHYKANNIIYGYNETEGDERHGTKFSPAVIEKIRKSSTGRVNSAETKEKKRQGRLGKKHSADSIELMREKATGRKDSDETKEKKSEIATLSAATMTEEERKERFGNSSGCIWINNGSVRTYVDEGKLDEYLANGWSQGMKIEGAPMRQNAGNRGSYSKEENVEKYGHEKGKKFMTNGKVIIKVNPDEQEYYESIGFSKGMKLKQQ